MKTASDVDKRLTPLHIESHKRNMYQAHFCSLFDINVIL